MTFKNSAACVASMLLYVLSALPIDNHHFYRASNFFYVYTEPRLERPWLTSYDVYVENGSTSKGRGSCDTGNCCEIRGSVDLLQIFGLSNMHVLGEGVPGKDLTNPADIALTNLALIPASNDLFGKFAFRGDFSLTEADLFFTQNFDKGFFFQSHVPIRKMSLTCIKYCDLTPTTPGCINADTPEWQTFLNLFDAILEKYNLCIKGFTKRGVGDTTLLFGWTNSYQDTEVLDFVDTTIRLGVLIPTGREKNENRVFDIALGYDGHTAFSSSFDIAFGALDWTTLGLHIGSLLFADKRKCIRLKTNFNQSGPVTLAKGKAVVDKGSLWDVSIYYKADHAIKGLSFLVGYTFARKRPDILKNICPTDCAPDVCVSNSDCVLRGWKMHTVHLMLEYDFTQKHTVYGPRVGVFYNRQVGGVRVFQTHMGGGNVGLDFGWKF